jgi:hypothetical protein
VILRGLSWAVIALCAIELCSREVARRSLAALVTGHPPSTTTIVVAVLVAATVLLVLSTPRRRTLPVLALAFVVGIAAQLQLGARLQSDGFYYFAYLRSLAFDHDVDFNNDYRLLGLGDKTYLFNATPTGYAHSAWTIGPAFAWAPFFGAAHVVAQGLKRAGVEVATDGTSYPYRQAICVAGLFYGLLGCWFCCRIARRFFTTGVAAAATTFTAAGSFIVWYFVKEPSMTHSLAFASVAAFVWLWVATIDTRTRAQWAWLGVLAGFMALVRWQSALFAILPAWDAARALWRAIGQRDRAGAQRVIGEGLLFLACAVIAFSPQMLAWKSIYGSYVARSPVGPAIRWGSPQIADILWSARNGLFSTSPILYLAAIGLAAFAIRQPAIGAPAIAAVALMVYFNAAIQDWWGSAAFGGRRFDGTLPLFVIGLAAFLDRGAVVVRRHAQAALAAGLSVLVLWNIALLAAAQAGVVRIGETLPFDRAWAAQSHEFHRWFGNPFSYPANLLFALRNGVSVGDYDLLRMNRFLSDPLRPYGRIDIGEDDDWSAVDGWHAPEREDSTTYRWASARARLRVALDHPARLRIDVRLHAFAFPGAPPQILTIDVNGTRCSPVVVGGEWQIAQCVLESSAWRSGVNAVVLEFSRADRPADVGIGGDTRALAAAVDYLRVTVVPALGAT